MMMNQDIPLFFSNSKVAAVINESDTDYII